MLTLLLPTFCFSSYKQLAISFRGFDLEGEGEKNSRKLSQVKH